MPRPYVRRRKINFAPKPQEQDSSGDDAYFQVILKFHDNILSIVKSLFVCLFVFAATPIAILAGSDFKKYKTNISKITSMIGEMMAYCLFLFLLYALFVSFFDLKSRNKKYLIERLKYVNKTMAFLSFALVFIMMVRCFMYFSFAL